MRTPFSSGPGRGPVVPALVVALASGCASTEHESRDWSTYDGPGAAYFQAEEIVFPHVDDPLERPNRLSALVNYWGLRYVVAPTGAVYRFVRPESVREHAENAGLNLQYPTRVLNNVLQGKVREAGVETARFAINTTVGVLGLFDPAQRWGLPPYPEDFGQTLAKWGWKDSTYLVVPLLGPRTVRDTLGEVPDWITDIASHLFPVAYVRRYNELANDVEGALRVIESAYDAYEPARTLAVLQREIDVDDLAWRKDQSGPTQTLSAIFLAPEETDFPERAHTGRVRLGGRELPYELWLQPGSAPLLYVLPGFGGHRLGSAGQALAEIGYRNGHSVVVISSPTNWEFMRHAASVSVPGYGPVDAYDAHVALTAIDRELEALHPGRLRERRLVGLSMGAYEALVIAAGAARPFVGEPRTDLLDFELFLALDPPVSLEHALRQLDRFYNAPLAIPPEERAHRIEEVFAKVMHLANGDLDPGADLPFTEIEARFLIGLAFRLDLQFLILQSQDLEDSGVLLTPRTRLHMAPAFREAAEFSYMEFFYAFVLPYVAARADDVEVSEEGARTLFERTDLHALEDGLRDAERVRVFANANDFLLREEDIAWLRETLGERLTLFAEGGHLGNLYRDYLKAQIGATLEEGGEGDAP
jgi:ABC-type transporter lipoprotein component MlaA